MEIELRRLVEHRACVWVVAAVLCFGVYSNGLGGEFVFDDLFLVRDAPHVRSVGGIWDVLGEMASKDGIGYRPVRTFSHMLEYQIFGLRTWGYHLTNVLLHVVFCVLLFRLGRRLGLGVLTSLAGMAVFALHPVHTEAVTYISGRRDLLFSIFFVGGWLSYMKGVREGKRVWVMLTFVFYALSIFSKEMGITLPVVIYAWEVLVNRRGKVFAALRDQPVFWGILWLGAAGFFVYRGILLPRTFNPVWWGGDPVTNFATVLMIHMRYLAVQVWPFDLQADYTPFAFDFALSFLDWRAAFGILVIVLSAALGVISWRRWPLVPLGVISYWVILLPVSHIIPHHEPAAEHHVYLPSVVVCLAVGAGLVWVGKRTRWAGIAAWCVLFVVLSAGTISRNVVWTEEELLWADTVRKAPWCARAQLNLAIKYLERRELDQAEVLLRRSFRSVDFSKTRAYLGNLYTLRREYETADRILRAGVRKWPKDRFILRFHALNLRFMGREDEAREVLDGAIRMYGWDPDLHFLKAGSYVMSDQPGEALEEYLEVLRIRPVDDDSRDAAIVLARALGKPDLAQKLENDRP